MAIADESGNVLVNYAYDSWGKVTEITGNTALAEQNPIRYRSYYYDFETVVKVNGQNVTVRGNVVNGIVRIGTSFIR